MSKAAKYDISIDQGSDFSMQVTLKDKTGALINLTGFVFTGQIRKTVSDDTVQASFVITPRDQNIEENRGIIDVSMTAAVSSNINLPAQKSSKKILVKMPYDIESVGGGATKRWLEGLVAFSPEITRA